MAQQRLRDERLPILRVRAEEVAPLALVCGDPERARQIAERLKGVRQVGQNREYVTYTGEYQGVRLTASSHGVGAAGAAICFEELIRAGAHTLIRVGTCGSYLPEVRAGGVIVGTAAVREDGVTPELVPLPFPAVADLQVTGALLQAVRTHPELPLGVGIVRSQAALYGGLLPAQHALWAQAGAVAVEMEYAALLVIASLRRIRAGGIFAVDGNPSEQPDMTGYNPHREEVEQAKQAIITIALKALVALAAPV